MESQRSTEPTELLVRFSRGQRDAWAEVYALYAQRVRRWVRRFFRSAFEEEEASQEVWLTVHRMQSQFDVNKGPLGGWLRALTANRCRELIRARGRRPDASVPIDDLDDALWLDAPLPDEVAMQSSLARAVDAFRTRLDAQETKVLQLAFSEGRTNEEVADALGVTVRQAKYVKKKLVAKAAGDAALTPFIEVSGGAP
ncbi:MAG: sigma-70 family RNA polymerase sigma factor [Archangium sp.]|nr:sigma-70 family RNA polymerase sigma factor [Archangium sp.]